MTSIHDQILGVFQGIPSERLIWQPRIYFWYYANRLPNKTPEGYPNDAQIQAYYNAVAPLDKPPVIPQDLQGLTMLEVYEKLHASPRYSPEVIGVNLVQTKLNTNKVKIKTYTQDEASVTEYVTPHGSLREVVRNAYHEEHLVKEPEDFNAVKYMLDNTDVWVDEEAVKIARKAFGDMGIPQTFFPRTPLKKLMLEWMGIEPTIFNLLDYPDEMEELMDYIGQWDDQMYDAICQSSLEILNFGENLDGQVDSPRMVEEYLLPYYKKRVDQFHKHGKYCHIHADGAVKPILSLLPQAGFDAIEAPTPLPQGDVSLEEMKEMMGDTILLDGIPALLFMDNFPEEQLMECVEKLIDLFYPRLILGISDELPANGNIERVRMVGKKLEELRITR